MNEENLIPFNQRTEAEQREIAKQGGIASGEARRRNKQLKTALIYMLELSASRFDGDFNDYNVPKEFDNNMTAIALGLIRKAQKGNVAAAKYINELTRDNDE